MNPKAYMMIHCDCGWSGYYYKLKWLTEFENDDLSKPLQNSLACPKCSKDYETAPALRPSVKG
jgi:predicted nucleic-acid-binding Zn-ribbon protein